MASSGMKGKIPERRLKLNRGCWFMGLFGYRIALDIPQWGFRAGIWNWGKQSPEKGKKKIKGDGLQDMPPQEWTLQI
jgi:hypothetical protein